MLSFFRKIRRKLANENSFLKYSRYAVGEIILVVIGILIALQINNSNESRKQNIELNEYLIKISQNIKEDIRGAISLKEKRDILKMDAQKVRIMISNEEFDIEKIKKVSKIFREVYFIPNTSGYEALKSSGYLGKLKNNKIDSLLHNYYTQIDNIENRETSFNEFIESMEDDFMIKHSFITFSDLMGQDSVSDVNFISVKEKKLRPFIYSNSFQAAVLRTAIQGTVSYSKLIRIGQEYIDEVEGIIK